MRRKVYYLSTCNTCKRIMNEVGVDDSFEQQNIKADPVTEAQLNEMYQLAGSYEALFSRVSRKYKELGLKDQTLSEDDYKQYILDGYTFLKRPVFLIGDDIFIGNSKKNVAALAEKLK
ncbi:arsenate reductase family protein [Microscilla marina]|uniref:Arsenate reductase family protein n=1 Tax=Microscilla marina ATCC 23134 TaxID=313606 RepID=A1ZT24_MICM2|nr:ArsC/Spx/MgsR family protein [Microscilla marina]EAY26414.1 arsenate reductase family protein [Microscilla marina ATCC 23134]